MVAVRVVADPQGNAVIGELRVFPAEANRPAGFAGQWSAAAFGTRARVPRGGLPGTLLRRQIKLSRYERVLRDALGMIASLEGLPAEHLGHQTVRELKADGFRMAPRSPFPPPRERGRGRRPVAGIEYARLARDYVAAAKNPVATLAKAWGQNNRWVTSRIARARRYGFLTPATRAGVRGGTLTSKAIAVLDSARSKKKS
jgi:hypothetical protein